MRTIILSLLFIAGFTQTFSQKFITTYYNPYWLLSSEEFSEYFRKAVIDTISYHFHGIVKDYYKNGRLEMVGTYKANMKQGEFLFYYPGGNLRTKGYYKDNIRWGIWTNYYEDGKVRDKIAFNDILLSVLEYYDENGNPKVQNGTGVWETQYYDEFAMKYVFITGSFKDSLRHGDWKYFTELITGEGNQYDTLSLSEKYKNGKFISGEYYDKDGHLQKLGFPDFDVLPETEKFVNTESWNLSIYASKDEYPFLKFLPEADSTLFPVNTLASFPGGPDSLRSKIARQIKLRKSYIKSQKHHVCIFKISINESGILKIEEDPNKTVVKVLPGELPYYRQVVKAITSLPVWNPASRNQKYVRCHFALYVISDSGVITIKLSNINQIILDPELRLTS